MSIIVPSTFVRFARAFHAALTVKTGGAVKLGKVAEWMERTVPPDCRKTILAIVDLTSLRAGASGDDRQRFTGLTSYARRLRNTLLSFTGSDGTLFVTTETIRDPRLWSREGRVFDPQETPVADFFGEIIRGSPGAIRGTGPLFNLTGFGKRAEIVAMTQGKGMFRPMGNGTVWAKLVDLDPYVLLIGAEDGADWTLLLPAHLEPSRYLRPSFFDRPWPFRVRTRDGEIETQLWDVHALRNATEYHFGRRLPMAQYAEALSKAGDGSVTEWIGKARLRRFRLSDRLNAQRRLAEDGWFLEDFGH